MDAIYYNYYPTFLYVDKYRFSSKWIYPSSNVPYALFRYIVSGTAIFRLNDKEYHVSPDEVFYIPQGSTLSCEAKEELVFISVRFVGSVQVQDADMLKTLWGIPLQHSFKNEPQVKEWFERMYTSAVTRNNFKMLEVRGYLNLICAALAKVSPKNLNDDLTLDEDRESMEAMFDAKSIQLRANKSAQKNDPRITAVLDYITAHPNKNFKSDQLCNMVNVSECTLRRLFKQHTGKTIYDFIKENKMTNAARRLLVTNDPISTIAYDLEYETPSYFGKCFCEVFGVSPQSYRKASHEA